MTGMLTWKKDFQVLYDVEDVQSPGLVPKLRHTNVKKLSRIQFCEFFFCFGQKGRWKLFFSLFYMSLVISFGWFFRWSLSGTHQTRKNCLFGWSTVLIDRSAILFPLRPPFIFYLFHVMFYLRKMVKIKLLIFIAKCEAGGPRMTDQEWWTTRMKFLSAEKILRIKFVCNY